MKEIMLNEILPELYEKVSKDMKWYESLGFVEDDSNIDDIKIQAARDYARSLVDPWEFPDGFESAALSFTDGVCWYIANSHIIKSQSANARRRAIKVAKIRYCLQTVFMYAEEDYNESDVITIKRVVESDFKNGIEWAAERNLDKNYLNYLRDLWDLQEKFRLKCSPNIKDYL